MENKICTKCQLRKTETGFQPSVGKVLDPQTAYNLVCQYSGTSASTLRKVTIVTTTTGAKDLEILSNRGLMNTTIDWDSLKVTDKAERLMGVGSKFTLSVPPFPG